ncbi:MAG: Nif3-like dinuclear metal center hexameric protein [Clostridiales bacterium]|nr:Nif3-like dinuclear metal center hexameric protein [Clostridiales bacterium]
MNNIKVSNVLEILNRAYPFSLALEWDNVGLLVGSPQREVTGIVTALDLTDEVIDKAIEINASLIITHHPIMFSPVRSILADEGEGKLIFRLIKSSISLIAAHTNFDAARGGVDEAFAKKICNAVGADIESIEIMEKSPLDASCGTGRIYSLNEKSTALTVAKGLETAFGAGALVALPEKEVSRVASVCGSGGDYWDMALKMGADLIITGESSYHKALDGAKMGISTIVLGHDVSEAHAPGVLADYLQNSLNSVQYKIRIECADVSPLFKSAACR